MVCDANSLVNHCTTKFVKSYTQLLSHVRLWNVDSLRSVHFAQQASDPLMTVLQYIAHTYMIDNVILIMTGALHGRSFEVS